MVDILDNINKKIYDSIVGEENYIKNKIAYILGGQPGSGKSSFTKHNQNQVNVKGAIVINGDDYRAFHPNYNQIVSTDIRDMPNKTQPFVNNVIETMLSTLSDENYNLIIEGTLRTSTVSQTTCEKLKSKGYNTSLIIVACDAEISWLSTISRAEEMAKTGEYPRFVPIEKYNTIVSNISHNLDYLRSQNCFDHVLVADRAGNVLYRETDIEKPSKALDFALNLKNWKQKYLQYAVEFANEQKRIMAIYNDTTVETLCTKANVTSALEHTLAAFSDLELENANEPADDFDFKYYPNP